MLKNLEKLKSTCREATLTPLLKILKNSHLQRLDRNRLLRNIVQRPMTKLTSTSMTKTEHSSVLSQKENVLLTGTDWNDVLLSEKGPQGPGGHVKEVGLAVVCEEAAELDANAQLFGF